MTNATQEAAQARAARIAGAMYLVTMATSVFSVLVAKPPLIWSGDATHTAQNILASERLFRVGIASGLATCAGVIVLIWALYVLLRPVDRNLALLAAFFRVVEVAGSSMLTLGSLMALRLLSGADYMKTFEAAQLHSLARLALSAEANGHSITFILLGLGSAVFAYLLLKSRYIPRALAGLGVFASLLLSACFLLGIVFPSAAEVLENVSFVFMGPYEVILGAWLLLKGASIRVLGGTETSGPAGV